MAGQQIEAAQSYVCSLESKSFVIYQMFWYCADEYVSVSHHGERVAMAHQLDRGFFMLARLCFTAFVLLTTLTMVACATTTGRPFDQAAASRFVDGKTTQPEVRAALGEPETTQDRGDGTTMWVYSASESKASVRDFIPFAGATNHPTRQMLALVFDHRGILESHTSAQSKD
jgi:outer membrane protein assembly factor BamE (lipoprotein component of BamABCDE complex)